MTEDQGGHRWHSNEQKSQSVMQLVSLIREMKIYDFKMDAVLYSYSIQSCRATTKNFWLCSVPLKYQFKSVVVICTNASGLLKTTAFHWIICSIKFLGTMSWNHNSVQQTLQMVFMHGILSENTKCFQRLANNVVKIQVHF